MLYRFSYYFHYNVRFRYRSTTILIFLDIFILLLLCLSFSSISRILHIASIFLIIELYDDFIYITSLYRRFVSSLCTFYLWSRSFFKMTLYLYKASVFYYISYIINWYSLRICQYFHSRFSWLYFIFSFYL